MKEYINKVKEFHNAFEIENGTDPNILTRDHYKLRYKLLKEENEEYLTACYDEDITEIADALADQLYITFGTILRHGLQDKIEEIFDEVHRSNMSKLENGVPLINGENIVDHSRPFGKILKGKDFSPPNIKQIIYEK